MMKRAQDLIGVVQLYRNWPVRIMEFFKLYPNKNIKYNLRNGLVFNIRANTSDTLTIIECFRKKVYDRYLKIGLSDSIVDIGGNIGAFSIYAASIAEKGTVYAFEPVEENFNLLEKNIKENNLHNIKVFKNGVAGKNGEGKLFLSNNKGGHSIYPPKNATGKSVIVKFVSLQQIFKENKIKCCDFLKIDCEGAEYDILFNCQQHILKKVRKIAMEFHDIDRNYNRFRLKQHLKKSGFSIIALEERPQCETGMLYAIREKKKD